MLLKKTTEPLVVLIEQNPWLMVIGSDSPTFALYNNGLLVYLDKEHKEYRSVSLKSEELDDFIKFLADDKDLYNLENSYNLSEWTDQPTNILFVRHNNRVRKINIYGNLNNKDVRTKAPKAFLTIFDRIIAYKSESAKTWLPEKIEIMIWPYEYAPEGALQWPKNWPDINDSNTKKRRETYSIFLDSSLLKELKIFMSKLKQEQAVLINGKKWAISYRYPFPSESEWMR